MICALCLQECKQQADAYWDEASKRFVQPHLDPQDDWVFGTTSAGRQPYHVVCINAVHRKRIDLPS